MKTINLLILFLLIAGSCFAQRNSYNINSYRKSDKERVSEKNNNVERRNTYSTNSYRESYDDIEFESYDKVERWRISIAGGPGYMFASSKDAENELIGLGNDRRKVKDFYKKYKLGWQGNADVHYLFNQHMGVGVKYALFATSSTLNDISFSNYNGDGLHIFSGDIDETLYVNYVGPTFLGQIFINRDKTWKASALISYGYTSYRMESYTMDFPMLVTGSSFGVYEDIGIEYFVGRQVALGLNISTFFSTLKKFNVQNNQGSQKIELPNDERENISRISGSLSFRIYL